MGELVKEVFAAPLATVFIVSGILFLLIAVVGTIAGKIEPGDKARMAAGVIGLLLIVIGLTMHILHREPSDAQKKKPPAFKSQEAPYEKFTPK